MKKILILLMLVVFIYSVMFMSISCKEEAKPAEEVAEEVVAEEIYEFTIVSQFPPNAFMNYVIYGMDSAVKDLGGVVKANYVAPETSAIMDQIALLNAAIADKVDGLSILITDPQAFEESIEIINDEGIPWGTFNTGFMGSGAKQLFYIGGDYYEDGRLLSEKASQEINVIRYFNPNPLPGDTGLDTRAQAITDFFKEQGIPGATIDATLDETEYYNRVKAFLIDNPDTNLVFGPAHVYTTMAVEAIKELGMDAKVAAFDIDLATAENIQSGRIIASTSQQFFLQGYLSVLNLYLYSRYGMTPPPESIVGPSIIDKSNVSEWIERSAIVIDKYGQG